jgi:hypothetical protein
MNRRELIKAGAGAMVTGFAASIASGTPAGEAGKKVEQWGVFETQISGPSAGNPFVDVLFGARFNLGHRTVDVAGFYDGDGIYKVRFSPDTVGRWNFETTGNQKDLAGHTGDFECVGQRQEIADPWEPHTSFISNMQTGHLIFHSERPAIRMDSLGIR